MEGLTTDEMNVPETQEKAIEHIVQEHERLILSDANIFSDNKLKKLISTLFDHSKRVKEMREKAIQILAGHLIIKPFLFLSNHPNQLLDAFMENII